MTRILIATDGSRQSLDAAQYLRTFASPGSVQRITVVAVVRPFALVPFATDFGEDYVPDEKEGLMPSFQQAAKAATEHVAAEVRDLATQIDTQVLVGSPAEEIVRAAEELDADLIVLGSRGLGVVRSVLLGSVSQGVLNHARSPVLVYRPRGQ